MGSSGNTNVEVLSILYVIIVFHTVYEDEFKRLPRLENKVLFAGRSSIMKNVPGKRTERQDGMPNLRKSKRARYHTLQFTRVHQIYQ